MADIFLHLAAQSLDSNVGVQPLIAPLFAPAPPLVSDTALPVSYGQPVVATEPDPFSIIPTHFAGEKIEQSEMEPPSEEIAPPARRAILSDLVPPDVPRNPVSTLSLRHLLQPPHLIHERAEPLSPASQSLAPVPISEEPLLEDTQSLIFPHDQSEQKNSNTRAERAPAHPSHFPSPPPVSPLPVQAQEGTLSGAISETTEEMPPPFVSNDKQKPVQENSFRTAPAKHESRHLSPKNQPVTSMGETFPSQNVSPAADSHVAPLAAPSVSPQPLIQSERSVMLDEVTDQHLPSLVRPAGISESPRPHEEEYERISKPAYQLSPGPGETVIEPLLDQPALAKEPQPLLSHPVMPVPVVPVAVSSESVIAPVTPLAGQEEEVSRGQASSKSMPQNLPHSALVSPKQGAAVVQVEDEVSPIRITIGRVVVRTTAPARPAPIQKRVLHPAQSLSEYLKQRERGRR